MAHVITPADREAFKRCRRAWDLGSRLRQGLEPAERPVAADVGAAVRDALAVWYFPGMWEWDRAIVRPLALEGYRRAAGRWPSGYKALADRGARLLDAYFDWAPSVDRFTPVRVETDFEVGIPDPADAERELVGPDGRGVHYAGRVELLVVDELDRYWLVDHRVGEGLAPVDLLALDENGAAGCWAWPQFFLGMDLAGVIYNELRVDGDLGALASGLADVPPLAAPARRHRRMYASGDAMNADRIVQVGNDVFRRTQVVRNRAELDGVSHNLALEAEEMTAEHLRVYPSPSWDRCSACDFRPPCLAMSAGSDPGPVLARAYRPRPAEQSRAGQIGGITWSIGRGAAPPTFGRGRGPRP